MANPKPPPGVSVNENMFIAAHKKAVLKAVDQHWIKEGIRYARFRFY